MKTKFFLLICICLLSSMQISFSQETNDVNTPIIGYNKDNGKNIVSFISQQDGPVAIRIYTVDGKAIISSTNFISKGENSFEVTLPEGIYILAISGNEFKYSGKFICRPITNGNPEIKVLNNTNNNIQINNLLYKVSPLGEPVVVIDPAQSITYNSALISGNVISSGNGYVLSKGVCWNTSPTPTINNNYVYSGSGSLDFTSNITGLNRLTTYYVRAYARYQSGEVKYGNEISFTTSASLPTITTNNIILGTSSAASGGNITDDGGSSVTSRGVCWSSTPSPTVVNNKTIDGEGVGGFSSTISGITIGQIYYVRAYATNTAGTAYGNERKIELKIGDNHEGGKIAYILVSGDPGYNPSIQHGLIAAPNDQVVYPTYDFWNSAVAFCNNLTLNDKNDWRLPTIVELQKMYQNKDLIGGFATYIPIYWSSTNDISNSNYAMGIDFYNGQISPYYKSTYDLRVRAVRNF